MRTINTSLFDVQSAIPMVFSARTGKLSGNTLALAKFVAEIVGDPLWSPTYTLSRSRI